MQKAEKSISREEVFELCMPEKDSEIVTFSSKKNVTLLAIIAPHVPYRMSPTRVLMAELSTPEEFAIETFVEKAKELGVTDKLYLLLHSYGGNPNSAYTIAKVLRKNFKKITTFIPQIAASSATLIAIASNEIVMGELSKLSPIDPIISTPRGRESSLATVRGFNKLNKKFEKTYREDIPYPYQHLIESIDLTIYEERVGLLHMVREYAYELLSMAGYKENECERISKSLVFDFPAHYYIIDFDKARKLGLKVKWYRHFINEWKIMRKWLGKYILEESGIHHVAYTFPKQEMKDDKEAQEE